MPKPETLFETIDIGYECLDRKECHGQNAAIKPAILNLQERMEKLGWVNRKGTILIDEINMVRGVIQKPKSEKYYFCIIASTAEEEEFKKEVDEFKKQQKYCDIE